MLKYVPTVTVCLSAGFAAWYTDSLFWGFAASVPFICGVYVARWFRGEAAAEVTSVPDIIPTYLSREKPVAYMWQNPQTGKRAYADIGLSAAPIRDEDGEVLPPVPGDEPARYIGPDYVGGRK